MYIKLPIKNIAVKIRIQNDPKKNDSPSKITRTAIIMGFLTYLYGPTITNVRVSVLRKGIKVPLPFFMNTRLHDMNKISPIPIIAPPRIIKYKCELKTSNIALFSTKINNSVGIIIVTRIGKESENINFLIFTKLLNI